MLAPSLSTAISAIALLSCSVNASPLPDKPVARAYEPSKDLSKLAKLMPQSDLAVPKGELKYVVLGLGTQNYTCTSGNVNAAPGTTGALAKLYDIGTKLNDDPAAQWKIPTISGLALALSQQPGAFDQSLRSQGYENIVGTHFFTNLTSGNTPTFALDQLVPAPYPMTFVTKINATNAPASACPGLTGEGAVPWLHLADLAGISQGGIDTVYRLETAGGKAPATCNGMKTSWEVKYAAQYWIFGPKSTPQPGPQPGAQPGPKPGPKPGPRV